MDKPEILRKSFLNKEERFRLIKEMTGKTVFKGKLWMIGFGAIGPSLTLLLLKLKIIDPSQLTVFDKNKDVQKKIEKIDSRINFKNIEITKDTYRDAFAAVQKDDIIADCAFCVCTCDMLSFCQERGCSHINSGVENWDYKEETDPFDYSISSIYSELNKINDSFKTKNTNFITSMAANPGNVSIWAKFGLEILAKEYGHKFDSSKDSFAELSRKLGVNVIHVSEKDTQLTNKPKQFNEYCNTWSSTAESMYEEAVGPLEGSWGTHELSIPADCVPTPKGTTPMDNDNYFLLYRRGISTYGHSYVPLSENYIGMIIAHEETKTLGNTLTVYENGKIVYKPSIYYVYHPTDSTMMSFYELKERHLEYQTNTRLLTDDIICGRDELGLTFFLENGDIWWIGSVLCIEESREIFEGKYGEFINATLVQAVAGYMAGIVHLIEQMREGKYSGLLCPEDLPYERILKNTLPFFGEFFMMKVEDWNHAEKYSTKFPVKTSKKSAKLWQFDYFVL